MAGPVILCGDTNACAEKPEPEMAWLSAQEEVPLVDCWDAVGDGTAGWTWDRTNPLTQVSTHAIILGSIERRNVLDVS